MIVSSLPLTVNQPSYITCIICYFLASLTPDHSVGWLCPNHTVYMFSVTQTSTGHCNVTGCRHCGRFNIQCCTVPHVSTRGGEEGGGVALQRGTRGAPSVKQSIPPTSDHHTCAAGLRLLHRNHPVQQSESGSASLTIRSRQYVLSHASRTSHATLASQTLSLSTCGG